jgi:hypothetical protein
MAMSAPLSLRAEAPDASLAGTSDGTHRDRAAEGGVVVALGVAAAGDAPPAVRWLDRPPLPEDPPAERLIATGGEGLWRVAPWPAADALFGLPQATTEVTIVTGAEKELRKAVAERAAARGVPIEQVERLDAESLAAAACVILAESPGSAFPARGCAVLAARRLLIVPRVQTSFGFEDGLDHLEFADPDEAITLVEAYRRAPDAFARVTAWGRRKAEPHRASTVYGRLASDLRLHGVA